MPSRGKRSSGCSRRKRRTSSAKAVSAGLNANSMADYAASVRRRRASTLDSIPPHQLVQRRPQIRAPALEVGMDRQRAPEQIRGFPELGEGQVAEALTRERAEMIRVAREGLPAVLDRAGIALREVSYRRALVPAFGELRRRLDQPREEAVRLLELLALHRLDPLQQERVELRLTGLVPQLPQRGRGAGRPHGIVTSQHRQCLTLGHGKTARR